MRHIAAEEFSRPPATGWPRVCPEFSFRLHGCQNVSERDGCETRSVIGEAVRGYQLTVVDESAARIDNVRYVTPTLIFIGFQQRLAKTPDDLAGIVSIEQKRTDAILSHRAYAMAQNQPSGIGLDGRSTVPELDQFPGKSRFEEHLALVPEVDVVGKHQVYVLVVLARKHGIEPVDFPREERHAFVRRGWTVQRNDPKAEETRSFHQLRHHHPAIVGGEGRVVDVGAVL